MYPFSYRLYTGLNIKGFLKVFEVFGVFDFSG